MSKTRKPSKREIREARGLKHGDRHMATKSWKVYLSEKEREITHDITNNRQTK